MTGDFCSFCGASGRVHRHHVTGRPAPGAPYFDGGLVVSVCPGCHANVHQTLRAVGVDFPFGHGVLWHRLVRVGCTAEIVGGAGRPLILGPGSARALAALARAAADALDSEAGTR